MRDSRELRARLRAAAWRAPLLAFGWWALLEDEEPTGMAFGTAVVFVATSVSVVLSPGSESRMRPRLVGVVRLLAHFFLGSLRGGWDVAVRALSLRLPLSPVVLRHSTRLAPGPAQKLFTSMLTLMPGTLGVDARGHDVRVHVLVDRGDPVRRNLQELEIRIADALQPRPKSDGATHA